MQLERLILQDMFAYQKVDLDLGGIGPGVIAIVGDNGSGKTALIEVVPAANWQKLPARENDHPKAYATSSRAFIEYWFSTDEGLHRALLQMSGDNVDGLLQRINGESVEMLNDGKVSTLKLAISRLFPSYELFINSSFAAQGRGDEFARTPATKRKELFAEFLGLAGLIDKAKTAAAAADECTRVRDRLIGHLTSLDAMTGEALACTLRDRREQLQETRVVAQRNRARTEPAIAELEARLAAMKDAVTAHGAATLRLQSARQDLANRRTEHDEQKARLREIEQQKLEASHAAGVTLGEAATEADARQQRAGQALANSRRRIELARDTALAEFGNRIAGNKKLQENRVAIDEAVAAAAQVTTQLTATRHERDAVQQEARACVESIRGVERELAALKPLEAEHANAVHDAALLESVPCHGESAYAGCQFLHNANAAKCRTPQLEEQLRPKEMIADRLGHLVRTNDGLREREIVLVTEIRRLETQLEETERWTVYAEPLKAADDRLRELTGFCQAEREKAATALQDAEQDHAATLADCAAARTRATDASKKTIADAEQRYERLRAQIADKIAQLELLTIPQAETAVQIAEHELQRVEGGNREATALQQALADKRADLERTVSALAATERDLAHVTRDEEALAARTAEKDALAATLAIVDRDLVEWRAIAQDLGKDGLVTLEIDASLTTITATANTLLSHCADGQFSLELVTQLEKKDGSEMKEAFAVRVMDNHRAPGKWRELRQLSGGQKTIVQEALMCAIALYVNDHSPRPIRTLWRDETGAALDRVNALQYVDMLRKVRELGGLHQVFFITHNADAAALADAQIVVADGGARIVLPPYGQAETAA